ncbi:hypothetical protein U1Q18_008122 [Sarracenia purpurea var. burkii]
MTSKRGNYSQVSFWKWMENVCQSFVGNSPKKFQVSFLKGVGIETWQEKKLEVGCRVNHGCDLAVDVNSSIVVNDYLGDGNGNNHAMPTRVKAEAPNNTGDNDKAWLCQSFIDCCVEQKPMDFKNVLMIARESMKVAM